MLLMDVGYLLFSVETSIIQKSTILAASGQFLDLPLLVLASIHGQSAYQAILQLDLLLGLRGIPQDQHCCGLQWTWSSGNKYQPLSQSWKCAISNCMNNDVIEFYLDYDNQTLMMYNQRTRQLDTWRGIQGEVHRTFQLCCSGDVASLPCQVTSSKENLRDGTIDECDYGTDQNVNPEVW